MKKDIYTKAKKKIIDLAEESVIPGVHSLDYVMGVKDMSETDRIFYEMYKLYGNRDHTWQYFKEMFNGDVQKMRETVKNWKTWDEINNEDIEEDSEDDIELDMFGNYSTYNPKIAQLETEFEKKLSKQEIGDKERKNLVKEYMEKMYELIDIENRDFVVAERIDAYREIIINDSNLLQKAISFYFLLPQERIEFVKTLLDKSAEKFGTPDAEVIQIETLPLKTRFALAGMVACYDIYTNRFYFRGEEHDLILVLETIAHEDSHRIDHFNPSMGMLGTQITKWSNPHYIACKNVLSPKARSLYYKNPTELSSHYIDKPVASALTKMVDNIRFPNKKSFWSYIKDVFVRN